jgi:predicted HicB family RNase H-like nuclease
MSVMSYKNYSARVEFDDEDGIFVGRIAGIADAVSFHATSVEELRDAFREGVDDYIATCAKIGKEPQKSYSGKLMLRIDPALHANIALAAEISGKSLNQWSEEVLGEAAKKSAA